MSLCFSANLIILRELCFSETGVFYGGGKKADQSQWHAVQTQAKGRAGVSVTSWLRQTPAAGVCPTSRGRVGASSHCSAGGARSLSCPPTGLASGSRCVTAGACRSLHPALPVAGRPHASSRPGETFLSSQSRRANISSRALPWVMSKVGTLRRDL